MNELKADTVETKHLLEQMDALEIAKKNTINSLLHERQELEKKTEARCAAIASELKALGYSKPRAARATKNGAAK